MNIYEAKRRWEEVLLRQPGVIAVGVADGYIVVYVKERTAAVEAGIPKIIEGFPVKIVEIGEVRTFLSTTDRWRPAPAGVSIGHPAVSAGTLFQFFFVVTSWRYWSWWCWSRNLSILFCCYLSLPHCSLAGWCVSFQFFFVVTGLESSGSFDKSYNFQFFFVVTHLVLSRLSLERTIPGLLVASAEILGCKDSP